MNNLLQSSPILVAGQTNSPAVVVVCEPPSEETFNSCQVMARAQMQCFELYASRAGFVREDVGFITCSPPIPETEAATESKTHKFLEEYRAAFWDAFTAMTAGAKMVIYLGKYAGRQVMGRSIKITQARGQIHSVGGVAEGPMPILPMLSPGNVLRRPEVAETFETDFLLGGEFKKSGYNIAEYEGSRLIGDYQWCLDLSEQFDLDNPPETMSVDIEGVGLKWYQGIRVLTVQMCWEKGKAIAIPLDIEYWNNTELMDQTTACLPRLGVRSRMKLIHQLRKVLSNPKVAVCGHNLKYDLHALKGIGINVAHWAHDSMQLSFVADDNMQRRNLDECVRRWLPMFAGYADCVAPETELLTADMRKVKAQDLKVGDELCAFDENSTGKKGGRRRLRVSVVEGVQKVNRPSYRITTESGRTTLVSAGHLMLSKSSSQDKGGGWRWRRADELTDQHILNPFSWEDQEDSYEAGYAARIFDGEGWACKGSLRLGYAQRMGGTLGKMRAIMRRAGIRFGHSTDKRKKVKVANDTFNGHEYFRILQKFRPERLIAERKWVGLGLPTNGEVYDRINNIKCVGDTDLVGIKTSTQTIIADGLLSHNSFNDKVDKSAMHKVAHGPMLRYACGDADVTRRLCFRLVNVGREDVANYRTYEKIQMPSLRSFYKMERIGLLLDQDALSDLGAVAAEQEEDLRNELLGQVPGHLKLTHLNNPKMKGKPPEKVLSLTRAGFVNDVMFLPTDQGGRGHIPRVFTDTTVMNAPEHRVPSASANDHFPYFDHDPFVVGLIDYSKLQKLRSTYIGSPASTSYRGIPLLKKGDRYGKRAQDIINEHELDAELLPAVIGKPGDIAQRVPVNPELSLILDAHGRPWWEDLTDPSGFWQYLSPQSSIHPSFSMSSTVTGRTACVRSDTKIPTRDRGEVAIRGILPSDYVWTHKGRWRRVVRGFVKPEQEMWAIHLSNGEILRCTEEHLLLPDSGKWASIRHVGFKEILKRQEKEGESLKALSRVLTDYEGKKTKKPSGGLRGWPGVSYSGSKWDTVLRSSDRLCGNAGGGAGTASTLASRASHRRGQNQQPAREPSTMHGGVKIEKIEPCGVHQVFDIEVEEDHSYEAAGCFSHNSRDPNGQNIPKRGDTPRLKVLVKAYRRCFKARPGYMLIEGDLSQAELRLVAWMASEQMMLAIYRRGGDIHSATAAKTMGMALELFNQLESVEKGENRFRAKAVNFGFIYGMWWRRFQSYAKTDYGIDLTESESEQMRLDFFELYNGLEGWHGKMKDFASTHGFVRSIHGALRRLPAVWSDDKGVRQEAQRQAINSPIQRFASDLGLIGMNRLAEACPWDDIRPVGFIHDAVIVEAKEDRIVEAMQALKWYLQTPPLEQMFGITPPLPLLSDVSMGPNLADMDEMNGEDGRLDIQAIRPDWALDNPRQFLVEDFMVA